MLYSIIALKRNRWGKRKFTVTGFSYSDKNDFIHKDKHGDGSQFYRFEHVGEGVTTAYYPGGAKAVKSDCIKLLFNDKIYRHVEKCSYGEPLEQWLESA